MAGRNERMKKAMMERVLKTLGLLVVSGLMLTWLTACSQSSEHAHGDHDHDHGHEHTSEGDGEGHHGDGDNDAGTAVAGLVGDADIAAQKAAYPLKDCLVGGEALGSMGDPVEHVHEGRLVQFCCEGCIDDFKKEPTKYLAKLDEAIAAAANSVEEGGQ